MSEPREGAHGATRGGLVDELRRRAARWLRAKARRLGPAGVYLGGGRVLTRTVHGDVMLVDGLDRSVTPALVAAGVWEPEVTSIVTRAVRPGMRTLDVGANFGYYTLLMSRAVGPTGRVFAFEPQSRLFAFLDYNIEVNGYARIARPLRLALGSRSGTQVMTSVHSRSGVIAGSGTLHRPIAEEWQSPVQDRELVSEDVEVVRLDDLDLGAIDFAKIDAEGSEPEIWNGGARTLAGARTIVMEYVPRWIGNDSSLLTELLRLGFRLAVVEPSGTMTAMEAAAAHAVAVDRGFVHLVLSK